MVGVCCCLGIIIILIIAIVLYFCCKCNSFNGPFSFNSKNLFANVNDSGVKGIINDKLGVGSSLPGRTIPSQLMPNSTHTTIANNIASLQGKPLNKPLYNSIIKPTSKEDIVKSSPVVTSIRNAAANAKAAANSELKKTTDSTYGKISDGNSMMIPMKKIAAAEQELWMANRLSAGQVSLDNLNYAGLDLLADTNIDYETYLDNLVIDERLLSNHSSWVNEMLPWSGTAQSVDNIDEALTNSFSFVGFSRPQSVAQDPSALFQTEADASTFIGNYNPFNKIN